MDARMLCTALLAAALAAGCAIRPAGEAEERALAARAGEPWEGETRADPELPPSPGLDDYLRYAFLRNADLEQRYWEWRMALERIPQVSSLGAPVLSFERMFGGESMSAWDRTTIGIFEQTLWPGKLATEGKRALADARAAGLRFETERFLLKGQVTATWLDLAILAESIRIQEENVILLDLILGQASIRVRAGTAPQQDLLKAQTELDLAKNDLANLKAGVPPTVAAFNALLGRGAEEPVDLPGMPATRSVPVPDAELLRLGAERSPELASLAREVEGADLALVRARQEYFPDLGIGGSITGSVSQMLGLAIALPLRLEAIDGAIQEARAGIRAAEAARTQYARDLAASFVLNLTLVRNDERQIALFTDTIIPRARQTVEIAHTAYAANRVSFVELLDSQRTFLDARLAEAELRIQREKAIAAIETFTAVDARALSSGPTMSPGPSVRAGGIGTAAAGGMGGMR